MSNQGKELSMALSTPDEYIPPQYLLSGIGLSRAELVAQYNAFMHSLRHVTIAPELVFERVVGNLKDGFSEALTQEHVQYETAKAAWSREKLALQADHAAAQEGWRREKHTLQADLARATAAVKQAEQVSRSRTVVPTAIPPEQPSSNQLYLQFWFSTTVVPHYGDGPYTNAHLAATTAPVPYGLPGSWPGMEHIRASADYGTYDTRMDTLITATALPMIVTHNVRFRDTFTTPLAVMVWLTGLSAARGAQVTVQVTANNITETGFALQIISGAATKLLSVGAAWAVWRTAEWGGMTAKVGYVSTVKPGAARGVHLSGSGQAAGVGGGDRFVVAVSAVDLVLAGSVWMDVGIARPSGSHRARGSTWKMSAGPVGSKVYSARLAYCASS